MNITDYLARHGESTVSNENYGVPDALHTGPAEDEWIEVDDYDLPPTVDALSQEMHQLEEALEDRHVLSNESLRAQIGVHLQDDAYRERVSHEQHDDADHLTQVIRDLHVSKAQGLQTALEDFTETFGKSLTNSLDRYREVLGQLQDAQPHPSEVAPGKKKIQHGRIWTLVNINGKPIKSFGAGIKQEEKGLSDLQKTVTNATQTFISVLNKYGDDPDNAAKALESVDKILAKGGATHLMLNTTITLDKNGVRKTSPQPPMAKDPNTRMGTTMAATGGAMLGLLIFGPTPLAVGGGAAAGSAAAHAAIPKDHTQQDAQNTLKFLEEVKALNKYMTGFRAEAEDLHKAIQNADPSVATKARSHAAGIISLMGHIVTHITEMTYAAYRIADVISDKKD